MMEVDGYTLDALPDVYSDSGVHRAYLCFVCVEYIDLVSLGGYTLDALPEDVAATHALYLNFFFCFTFNVCNQYPGVDLLLY